MAATAAAATTSAMDGKVASAAIAPKLSAATIDPRVVRADYAVRGEIVRRASLLEEELQAGKQLPFDKIVWCNIGNPQILGQKPITYFRQVLSLCEYPQVCRLLIRICCATSMAMLVLVVTTGLHQITPSS